MYVRLVLLLLFISLLLISCKREEVPLDNKIASQPNEVVDPLKISQELFSPKTFFAIYDSLNRIFVGIEEDSIYGIKFFAFDTTDGITKILFKSPTLDGTRNFSNYKQVELNSDSSRFIYYNSGINYIGSRNVEVYQYLFSLDDFELYSCYANLIAEEKLQLIYSNNLKSRRNDFIVDYFNSVLEESFIEDYQTHAKVIKYE